MLSMSKDFVEKSLKELPHVGQYMLRTGAFDLARRVRGDLMSMAPMRKLLARHLSEAEKAAFEL
jgi:hypothetical protein